MNEQLETLANDLTTGEGSPLEHFEHGSAGVGTVGLENENRFSSRNFSIPLTQYALGWRDPNGIEDFLDFIAPPVQTGRRVEFKKATNGEQFYSEADDVRAIGAAFKTVDYTGTTAYAKTLNKGLRMRLDVDELDQQPDWEKAAVRQLKQRLLRNELRRVVAGLIAASANTAKTWDTTAGKDPDQDVLGELLTAVDASGVRPNRLVYGDIAWNKRAICHRAQNTAGGYASAGLTPETLAYFLGVEALKISRHRYQSSAAAKTKIVPDVVLGFYAENEPGIDDPSNSKRFWSQCRGGDMFGVYIEEIGKFVDVTVEHYSVAVIPSVLGLRMLTIG